MDGNYDELRQLVLDSALHLFNKGFIQGTGGNVSVRVGDDTKLIITPSQREYPRMKPSDICVVGFDQKPVVDNGLMPSLETPMHISIYKNRPDVGAIVHTHQAYASIFALINQPIPALFDEVAINIGNVVEVVPYGFSGSPKLIANVNARLKNRCLCYVLQNHGALALGTDLARAMRHAELLEKCAEIYYRALCTGRSVSTLPTETQTMLEQIVRAKQDAEIARREGKSQED